MKRVKEAMVVLLFLLLASVTLHMTLRADVALAYTMTVERTFTYSPYDFNFTIIVLPDTQYYSESYPHVFDSQTQWIINNIETMNIVFVTHLGDIVDEWNDLEQWENANHSLSILDGNVPWGAVLGNHDGIGSDQTNFEMYFGYDRFSIESWYGGAYQNNNRNSYQLFSAGGNDYLILHLQYDPSDAILAWAGDIIDNYPTRRVIVSTHEYIAWPWEGWRSPIGENIYQQLVKPHADQIFLVFCGHLDVEDHRTAVVGEHAVYEVVTDYQEESNGGDGWLKILEFSPLHDKIFVRTYSPYLDAYHQNPDSHFTLDYNMTSTQANITIHTINSTLSDFVFDNLNNQINFTVSGEPGTIGYFNITIPHEFNLGNSWDIKVDGESSRDQSIHPEKGVEWTYPSQNTTHTSLFLKYVYSDSPYQISVVGTEVIHEFTPAIILSMFVIATLMAIIFSKRKLRAHRSDWLRG